MICETPYYDIKTDCYFPCGKCIPCRIKRKMEWVTRVTLEADKHDLKAYVTLTLDDDNLMYGGTDQPTLYPKDLTDFIKRLRRKYEYNGFDTKIRYFACGEYGDESKRPHYHLILLGIGENHADIIRSCWNKGIVDIKPVKKGAIEYVAGYCVKKSIELKVFYKEKQVEPEFFRSSLGMGRHIVKDVIQAVKHHNMPDVPRYVMRGKKKFYLTRYWIKKIREACYTEAYCVALTTALLSLVREKIREDIASNVLASSIYDRAKLSRDFGMLRFYMNEIYQALYKDTIRANMLKYSQFLAKRNRLCQKEVNST